MRTTTDEANEEYAESISEEYGRSTTHDRIVDPSEW